jgi:hypothetical protein
MAARNPCCGACEVSGVAGVVRSSPRNVIFTATETLFSRHRSCRTQPGTDGSNPSLSSGESANHRFLSGGHSPIKPVFEEAPAHRNRGVRDSLEEPEREPKPVYPPGSKRCGKARPCSGHARAIGTSSEAIQGARLTRNSSIFTIRSKSAVQFFSQIFQASRRK